MFKIYVDGQHGTTGLLVNERLAKHPEVEVMEIPFEERHNKEKRLELLNSADLVFLCLPDDAAKEAAAMITNPDTKVIDASTAHRTNEQWAYGFAELSPSRREAIQNATRVANPGCHATASISALYPLVQQGIIDKSLQLNIFSITGYSGGGKQMIKTYETTEDPAYNSPREYGLGLTHKHLPEMVKTTGLTTKPIFMPIVSNYERGLAVTIPVAKNQLKKQLTRQELAQMYQDFYADAQFVRVHEADAKENLVENCFNIQQNNDTNYLDLYVYGNDDQYQIIAVLDNLGKGASGAAIQNMNIMLGLDEATGL